MKLNILIYLLDNIILPKVYLDMKWKLISISTKIIYLLNMIEIQKYIKEFILKTMIDRLNIDTFFSK